MSTDLCPDADLVEMVASAGATLEEVHQLAIARRWDGVSTPAQLAVMAVGQYRDAIRRAATEQPSHHVAHERRGDWIVTHTGGRFYALDPRPEEISLLDITYPLSKRERWNCILLRLYSVGEHSVRVAGLAKHLARLERLDDELAWAHGLVHDGNEALITDIPRPIKAMIREWPAIEARVQEAVQRAMSLWPIPADIGRIVTLADNLLLLLEARDPTLFPDGVTAMAMYRPEIRDAADQHLTAEAEAAAEYVLPEGVTHAAHLRILFAIAQDIGRARTAERSRAQESAEASAPGRKEYLSEMSKGGAISASDFEPPPHLRGLLGERP